MVGVGEGVTFVVASAVVSVEEASDVGTVEEALAVVSDAISDVASAVVASIVVTSVVVASAVVESAVVESAVLDGGTSTTDDEDDGGLMGRKA